MILTVNALLVLLVLLVVLLVALLLFQLVVQLHQLQSAELVLVIDKDHKL